MKINSGRQWLFSKCFAYGFSAAFEKSRLRGDCISMRFAQQTTVLFKKFWGFMIKVATFSHTPTLSFEMLLPHLANINFLHHCSEQWWSEAFGRFQQFISWWTCRRWNSDWQGLHWWIAAAQIFVHQIDPELHDLEVFCKTLYSFLDRV